MKYIFSILLLINIAVSLPAQDLNPVAWTFEEEMINEELVLTFQAAIQEGWYLYAQEIPEDGPIPTSFNFESPELEDIHLEEKSKYLIDVYDEMFGINLKKYKKDVVFTYKLDPSLYDETISGYVEFMCCNGTECLPPKQIDFTFNLKQ